MSTDVELVVIGASWGGLHAVGTVLEGLASGLGLPVVIAQHRAVDHGSALADLLGHKATMPLHEVEDKEPIKPNHVYLAPADYHVLVEPGRFALSTDAAVWFSRPSVDVLFESAAEAYRDSVVAVVLTGANEDGADGVRVVHRHGGYVIAQDPEQAERPEMPAAAIATGAVDVILPLPEIAPTLNELCREGIPR